MSEARLADWRYLHGSSIHIGRISDIIVPLPPPLRCHYSTAPTALLHPLCSTTLRHTTPLPPKPLPITPLTTAPPPTTSSPPCPSPGCRPPPPPLPSRGAACDAAPCGLDRTCPRAPCLHAVPPKAARAGVARNWRDNQERPFVFATTICNTFTITTPPPTLVKTSFQGHSWPFPKYDVLGVWMDDDGIPGLLASLYRRTLNDFPRASHYAAYTRTRDHTPHSAPRNVRTSTATSSSSHDTITMRTTWSSPRSLSVYDDACCSARRSPGFNLPPSRLGQRRRNGRLARRELEANRVLVRPTLFKPDAVLPHIYPDNVSTVLARETSIMQYDDLFSSFHTILGRSYSLLTAFWYL
ncbi:hypothetical protein B0H19DRAFT_1383870 [Mycena capillaripes]|nr:hypothetical protein B0H19DRAFT_1383870 [Mycena capillaripes]